MIQTNDVQRSEHRKTEVSLPTASVAVGLFPGAEKETDRSLVSPNHAGFLSKIQFECDKGIGFRIRQGIRGLLLSDEHCEDVAYMICEPASHYYKVMTRSKRMPVLIGERI